MAGLALVLLQAGALQAQAPASQPVPARISATSEDLLAGGEQILTDGTFVQATRFGTNAADLTTFGIKWAKWPGTPAAQFPDAGAAGYNIINSSWTPLYVVNGNCRTPEEVYGWNLFQFKPCNAKAADTGVNIPPAPQVLGAQMCAWEQGELLELPSLRQRLAAMSERIWSPDAGRTFADFSERLRATDPALSLLVP